MLVLTRSALGSTGTLPTWDGLRVLVRTPGDPQDGGAPADVVVVDYLQPAPVPTQMLCDVTRWLRSRLADGEAAVLFLDRPLGQAEIDELAAQGRTDPDRIAPVWKGDRLIQLSLGAAIAASPLLPRFFDAIAEMDISDDRTLVRLLGETFD